MERSAADELNESSNPARRLRLRYLLSFASLAAIAVAGTLTMRMLAGAMEAALHDAEALARVAWLERAELLFTLSSLLVLVVAALFVLEPAVRLIRKQFLDAQRLVREVRTAQARADESDARLRGSEARYRALAENANEIIIGIDGAQSQLFEKQKLEGLGVLASGIAHDFNNLLASMLGNVQLALQELPDRTPARRRLQRVLAAGKRAAELTNHLSTYAGGRASAFQPVDLCKLVEEMADLLQVSVSKKITLCCALPGDLPAVDGDPTQLRQVIMNLILNASEAIGKREGTVRVEAGSLHVDEPFRVEAVLGKELRAGEHVFVRVSDDGPGMDAETRRRIFDPFYTTKLVGRGLGLAVTLGIVRSHRGAILVESVGGRGTTLTVALPAASRGEVPQTREATPRSRSSRGVVGIPG